MKNKLMLALLVSTPFAVCAMEQVATLAAEVTLSDPLAYLKEILSVKTEIEVANYVRGHIGSLEKIAEADLIKALTILGQNGKLADVHQVVAATCNAPASSAGQGTSATTNTAVGELQAALAKAEAMVTQAKAAATIATTAYALVTDPNNQQKVAEIEQDLGQAGCKNCVIL